MINFISRINHDYKFNSILDPIAQDYRTCVCPFIDVIDAQDYQYRAQDEGNRGAFEWNFLYKRIDIRPGDHETPADNFPSPVMAGNYFNLFCLMILIISHHF